MLTVLMATYNGSRTLPLVLDAHCKLDSPRGGWKLVIVDNGSTDDTKKIIASFTSRLPLSYIFEPRVGKNVALNTGLASVEGDLVVFTDDDALPQPDWLVQLRAAADSQPSFSVFGGTIVPHWERPPESWILPFWWLLAITDPEWREGPTDIGRAYGPNMAMRSEIIRAGHRFDPSLGPMGPRYQMGDEAELLERLGKAGYKGWHCKGAVVAHIIRTNQMQKKWMLRRAVAHGRAMYPWEYNRGKLPTTPALFLGIPRYLVRQILVQAIQCVRARLSQDADIVFKERWHLYWWVGHALGGRGFHKTR